MILLGIYFVCNICTICYANCLHSIIFAEKQTYTKLIMTSDKKSDITTGIYLDTRRSDKDGAYPVKLRVTYKRRTRLFKTKFHLTEDDFQKTIGERPRNEYKVLHQKLIGVEKNALEIISNLKSFTFDAFKRRLVTNTGDQGNVFSAFKEYIAELDEDDRVGNSSVYTTALHSIQKFHPGSTLDFSEISSKFLKRYEKWMIDNGATTTTVGIYLRCVRRLFNRGIQIGFAKREDYPFGREHEQYQIPEPKNVKKALSIGDIQKIFSYTPDDSTPEAFSRDIWIFSYLCNGINMKDICLLRYADITNDNIVFRRAKTAQTNRKSRSIEVVKTKEINTIIEKWGQKRVTSNTYIFPILVDNLTLKKQKATIAQATKQVNKYIRRIAKNLKMESDVTTYTARHSFATILKNAGVNVSYISEALGHSDITTTQGYFASFENDEKKRMASILTNFPQEKTKKKAPVKKLVK